MPNKAIVDGLRVVIEGRFQDDFEKMALDMLNDAISVEDIGDFEIIQTTITGSADNVQMRVDLASDSLSWQGFEYGRVEAMDQQGLQFMWVLDAAAQHCSTCLAYANGGPYTIETLPGVPGEAPTECNGSCRCNLEPVRVVA